MQIVVGVYSPNPEDATSLYRGWGPYGHLARRGLIRVVWLRPEDFNRWNIFQEISVVVFQRPTSAASFRMIEMVKNYGCRVVVDYDDDYFNIPDHNKTYLEYKSADAKCSIIQCISSADIVTVSTQAISESINSSGLYNVVVIPNAIEPHWFGPLSIQPKVNDFSWRGLDSHAEDLREYKSVFLSLGKQYPNSVFDFFGYFPFFIARDLKNTCRTYKGPLFNYFTELSKSDSKVGLVPLEDTKFNRAKSNIAALELIMSGHVVVATNLPEFKDLPIITCTKEGFSASVEKAFSNYNKLQLEAYNYVTTFLTLDVVNQKRIEIIRELASKGRI